MKPIMFTTIMVLLVAVPFLLGKRKADVEPVKIQGTPQTDEERRYDIFDFIS